ncbi:Hypothetical predicted protein [Mytilus galloprovincialis]|uniref:Uncharacterized protein n=1 Tax=Mytilus galloprovincialis TaxID=29158 RepID=A0A8B6BHW4_MYTGA|nr:Hypothetical predicted protein [Mytilus galloprovincialis]
MNTSVSATVYFEAFKCTEKAVVPPKTLPIYLTQVDNEIQDDIEIDQSFIAKFVKHTTDHTLSDKQIRQLEQLTKGQSDNSFRKQIHILKATASDFGKIINCSRNSDSLLKAMFYSEPHSAALSFGKENEDKAIEAYKQYMDSKGSNVQSVGKILSKDRQLSIDMLLFMLIRYSNAFSGNFSINVNSASLFSYSFMIIM